MKVLSALKKGEPINYCPLVVRLFAAVLAAHIIITFDEPESLFELMQMPAYYMALVTNSVMASAIIELINAVTRRLDHTKPWVFAPLTRILRQVLEGIVLPLALSILLAIIYFALYGIHIMDTVYFDQYFLIIVLLVILANAYYFIHFGVWIIATILKFNKQARIVRKMDMPASLKDRWPTTDIALIQTENEEYFVTTSEGERLAWPDTLETTITNLPYEDYFLINRSTIVKIDNIANASLESSRRILLTLHAPAKMEVYVSQRQYAGCKDWLELNKVTI